MNNFPEINTGTKGTNIFLFEIYFSSLKVRDIRHNLQKKKMHVRLIGKSFWHLVISMKIKIQII